MMDDIWRYKGQKDPPRCEGSSRVAVVYYVGTPENEDVFWLHLFEISFYGRLKMFWFYGLPLWGCRSFFGFTAPRTDHTGVTE